MRLSPDSTSRSLRSLAEAASLVGFALRLLASFTTPGYLDVSGVAWTSAPVTVNGQATDRQGEYWHAQLSVANTNQPVWQDVAAVSGSSTNRGDALVPPHSPTLSYDADGNLLSDGLWTYAWDGENRLVSVESAPTLSPATARRKVEFSYDHRGRRVTRQSYTHDGSFYQLQENLLLVYDGWNLLAELDATNRAVIRSYAWGLDLANALPSDEEGAGGIGGLVLVKSHVSPVGSHFPAYDGNGNVVAQVDTGGTVSARYEYGPFGEPLTVWGAAARLNPFRWSTKQTDNETDLVYYGYRYYSPSWGRWISRDPMQEEDARVLYSFLGNHPINRVDIDGRTALQNIKNIKRFHNLYKQARDILKVANNPALRVGMMEPMTRLVSSGAYGMLYAAVSVFEACTAVLTEGPTASPGTVEANAIDFVVHTVNSDISAADLDAATLAAQIASPRRGVEAVLNRGLATSDAVIAWMTLDLLGSALSDD